MSLSTEWRGTAAGGGAIPELFNLVKNPKPDHAAATKPDTWTEVNATSSTYAYADGGAHDGITSKQVTITGAAGCNTQAGIQVKERVAGECTAGDVITFAAVFGECTLTGCTLKMRIYWYDASNAAISQSDSAQFTPGAPFAQHVHTATAPANATQFKAQILANGNFHSGDSQVYSICEVIVTTTASTAPVWFDGDSIGCHWSGTRDASVSHKQLARPESGYWVIEDASTDKRTQINGPTISVTPGRYYGAMALVTMTACNGGTFSGDVCFYDATDTYVSGYSFTGSLTSAAGEDLYAGSYPAPLTATQAFVRLRWTGGTTPTDDCIAKVRDVHFGEGVVEVPAVVPCDEQHGDFAAPWGLTVDGSTGELTAFYAGRYADETADISDFVFELHDKTWTDVSGTGDHTADAAGYPDGSGDTLYGTEGQCYADLTTGLAAGTYHVIVRAKTADAADPGSATVGNCEAVTITGTTLDLYHIGTVALPENGTLRLTLTGAGSGDGVSANILALVPASFGGAVGWRASSGHAHTLAWSDDALSVDGVTDLSDAWGGRAVIGLGGLLVVIAEQATPAPTTAVAVAVAVDPRWEHFPSA